MLNLELNFTALNRLDDSLCATFGKLAYRRRVLMYKIACVNNFMEIFFNVFAYKFCCIELKTINPYKRLKMFYNIVRVPCKT